MRLDNFGEKERKKSRFEGFDMCSLKAVLAICPNFSDFKLCFLIYFYPNSSDHTVKKNEYEKLLIEKAIKNLIARPRY